MRNYVNLRSCHNQEKQKNNSLHSGGTVCQLSVPIVGKWLFPIGRVFWIEGFGSVTCKEQQGDKKYHSKYGWHGAYLQKALRFHILFCKLFTSSGFQCLQTNIVTFSYWGSFLGWGTQVCDLQRVTAWQKIPKQIWGSTEQVEHQNQSRLCAGCTLHDVVIVACGTQHQVSMYKVQSNQSTKGVYLHVIIIQWWLNYEFTEQLWSIVNLAATFLLNSSFPEDLWLKANDDLPWLPS